MVNFLLKFSMKQAEKVEIWHQDKAKGWTGLDWLSHWEAQLMKLSDAGFPHVYLAIEYCEYETVEEGKALSPGAWLAEYGGASAGKLEGSDVIPIGEALGRLKKIRGVVADTLGVPHSIFTGCQAGGTRAAFDAYVTAKCKEEEATIAAAAAASAEECRAAKVAEQSALEEERARNKRREIERGQCDARRLAITASAAAAHSSSALSPLSSNSAVSAASSSYSSFSTHALSKLTAAAAAGMPSYPPGSSSSSSNLKQHQQAPVSTLVSSSATSWVLKSATSQPPMHPSLYLSNALPLLGLLGLLMATWFGGVRLFDLPATS